MIKMTDLIRIRIVIMMSSIEFQVQLDYSARSSLILIRKGEVIIINVITMSSSYTS